MVVHETEQLIVLSTSEVASVPLHRCNTAPSCGDCVALQDPYCAWDIKSNTCEPYKSGLSEQLQNVNIGYHPQCPVPILDTTTTTSTTTTEKMETTEKLTTVFDNNPDETTIYNCPQCSCDCTGSTTSLPSAPIEDEFVDLLDIYNQTDLDNGIFDQGIYFEIHFGILKQFDCPYFNCAMGSLIF